jgi:mannose-6-phosphate isomerase-like protein (cupin superfamily)
MQLHRRRTRDVRPPATIIVALGADHRRPAAGHQSQVLLDLRRQYYRRNENFIRRNRSATRHIHSEVAGHSFSGKGQPAVAKQKAFSKAAAGGEGKNAWTEVSPGERFFVRTPSDDTNGAYSMLELVAAPGSGTPMHIHDNEDEHLIILEGMARIANGDETVDLPTGATLTVRKGVPHAWCNLSEAPLRMLAIFTPGAIDGLFREIADGGNIDLASIASKFGTRIVGPTLLEG